MSLTLGSGESLENGQRQESLPSDLRFRDAHLRLSVNTTCRLSFEEYLDYVESLQSHMILTMSHWSSGLTCLLPVTRVTGSNPHGGLM